MIDDDNDGQMIFGDFGGLKLPDICLTGDQTRALCVAETIACPTAVTREIHKCVFNFFKGMYPIETHCVRSSNLARLRKWYDVL